jgi:hypothetical protein
LGDRFSERKERSAYGKLRTQAEKEALEKVLDDEDDSE